MTARTFLAAIWGALEGDPGWPGAARIDGEGSLPACFAVSDLAAGAVAAAALAAAEYAGIDPDRVRVNRRLASLWFGWSFQAVGWQAPDPRSAMTGDYATADGWIRLHANAPHHERAALRVLQTEPASVAAAVRRWEADALEAAIVADGGCAAAMRDIASWETHPQGVAVAAEPVVRLRWECGVDTGAVSDRHRPLAGVRVLDLTRVFAGPVCTRILAGLGADVLRIDPPGWDEPGTVPDMTLGKRCARLDARTRDGRERLRSLMEGADVLVHGYRRGALDRLGFGEAVRRGLRPGLVDVSLNAYGATGPWADRRGFDSLVQMSSGIAAAGMRLYGASRPTPLPVQALDHAAGTVMAAAALRGLSERRRGRAMTASTSLARMAALLLPTAGPQDMDGRLGEKAISDFSPAAEPTEWGTVRRLRSPWLLDGAGLRWARPASRLGSAEPVWAD